MECGREPFLMFSSRTPFMKPFFSEKVLVVPKWSRLECEMRKTRQSMEFVLDYFDKKGVDIHSLERGYQQNNWVIQKAKEFLDERMFVERDDLTNELVKNKTILLSIGGDNHFQYVSHFADEQIVIGINSDPGRSDGALTSFMMGDLDELVERMEKNDVKMELWPRLQVELNGKKIFPLAASEIFLGEQRRDVMSRHVLEWNGKKEDQKSSGLIVSTPAGMSGWFHSAMWYVKEKPRVCEKSSDCFSFVLTEPHVGRLSTISMLHGIVGKNDSIAVYSKNNDSGILSIDYWKAFPFPEGSIAKIGLGKPLRVGIRSYEKKSNR